MPYQTPPTFTTGAALSAAQLNILSDNQEYFNGFVISQNPAMVATKLTADGDVNMIIRHTQRYLHVRWEANDRCRIYYDATKVYDVSGVSGTVDATIDLNPYSLVYGQLYTLKFTIESTAAPLIVSYAYEASS